MGHAVWRTTGILFLCCFKSVIPQVTPFLLYIMRACRRKGKPVCRGWSPNKYFFQMTKILVPIVIVCQGLLVNNKNWTCVFQSQFIHLQRIGMGLIWSEEPLPLTILEAMTPFFRVQENQSTPSVLPYTFPPIN